MLEWLRGLSEANRALLVGLVVQYLVQAIKWAAGKAGMAVEEAKITKLVAAILTAGVATYLITGNTGAFWQEWLFAAATAVLLHEAGNKLKRKAVKVLDDAASLAYGLLAVLLVTCLACTWCAGPSVAGDLPLPEATLVGSLDGGPTLGAAASWHVADLGSLEAWADVGIKREEAGTDWFAGGSTPAAALLDTLPVIRLLAPAVDRVFPAETRLGAGYLFDAREPWVYLATGIRF